MCLLACGKANKDEPGKKAGKHDDGPDRISNHALATTPLSHYTGKAGPIAFAAELPIAELNTPEIDATRARPPPLPFRGADARSGKSMRTPP